MVNRPMSLSPKIRRVLWVAAALFVLLLALGGLFTWMKFFREEKQVFANEEEQFKYGSLGAEGDRGIPYYLWLVLPRVFPDLMPGPGGYKSFGVVWEEGHEIPVGFSKKVVGFDRITNNCAICHTATYRSRKTKRRTSGRGGQPGPAPSHAPLSCSKPHTTRASIPT